MRARSDDQFFQMQAMKILCTMVPRMIGKIPKRAIAEETSPIVAQSSSNDQKKGTQGMESENRPQ